MGDVVEIKTGVNIEPGATIIATPIKYAITKADIEAKRATYAALSADTPKGYESVRLAIADCRGLRVAVENRRKELKADALEYGRKVDAVAKELTGMLEELEEPLRAKKVAIDDEKARMKREAEEAKQREIEAKLRVEREAEESRLRALREAEEKRLAEERAYLEAERAKLAEERRIAEDAARAEREAAEAKRREEQARIDAERRKLDEERKAQEAAARVERERVEAELRAAREAEEDRQRAEQARIAEERAKVEAERRAVEKARQDAERAEFERQARIRAEEEAKAKAEAERAAAEERRVAELERKAAEERRLEAIRPDIEKVRGFGWTVRQLLKPGAFPEVSSPEADIAIMTALGNLETVAAELESFSVEAVK